MRTMARDELKTSHVSVNCLRTFVSVNFVKAN